MPAPSLMQAEADRAAGRLDAALAGYRAVLAADPAAEAALIGLCATLDALNRPGTPEEAVARSNFAEGLRRRGRVVEAEAHHRAALGWLPDFGGIHFNLAVLLQAGGRLEEAAGHYGEAARRMPRFAPAFANLGTVARDLGRLDAAEAAFRTAIALDAGLTAAWAGLGGVARSRGNDARAVALWRVAAALAPALAELHANLGVSLKDLGRGEEALGALSRALTAGLPDEGGVLAQLVQQRRHLCRWDGLEPLSRRLTGLAGTSRQIHPWIFLGQGAGPAAERACAEAYAAWRTRTVTPLPAAEARGAGGPIRLGYLSADFHEHATAVLLAEVIECHDRRRFHVAAYSYGPDDGGPMRARLRRGFDAFHDIAALSHADAARKIRADGIDILIDLKGFTQGARPEIPAHRPAPVQVQWLGYPGTMGAGFIDYIIGDAIVTPPGCESGYRERIVRLPQCYQPNDRTRPIVLPPGRAACGLPADGVVFCAFNALYKITPVRFALWMDIVRAVPGSVLWLLAGPAPAMESLRTAARSHGVDADRLVFAARRPLAEYLGLFTLADLFLDTHPVGAHTTASDALWAGLPVLTHRGPGFAARVAASLLHAVGLPELAVATAEDYRAAAIRLGYDPAERAALHARLAQHRDRAPLFDTPRFTHGLEVAFAHMAALHRSGQGPQGFELEPSS